MLFLPLLVSLLLGGSGMSDSNFSTLDELNAFYANQGGTGLVDTTPIVTPDAGPMIGNKYWTRIDANTLYDTSTGRYYDNAGNPTGRYADWSSPVVGDPAYGDTSVWETNNMFVRAGSDTTTTDTFVPAADARNTINAVLATYGLDSLSSYLYDVYARQEVDVTNSDALLYAIKDQPAYQQRFAGNTARTKKGLSQLSPGTYVGLEDAYRRLLQANGLPAGFYDNIEDFQKFIEADTSPSELQDRIQLGFNEVDRADPLVLKQIQLLYPEAGIGDSRESLAAFFLDPVKAAPLLARRAQAAKIGARSFEAGFGQLTASTAEGIAARGYSDSQVQSVFSDLGTQAGLLNEMTGEAKLSQDEKLGAGFGYDSAAKVKLERRKATRKAIFESGGRGTATSGRGGTTESGYGTAQ